MMKWLIIFIVVIIGFLVVLLSLGYMLKEHEIETTALKEQLDRARQIQQKHEAHQQTFALAVAESNRELKKNDKSEQSTETSNRQTNLAPPQVKNRTGVNEQTKQVLLENLTCVASEQCVLVELTFTDKNCLFAVNTIGAALLSNYNDHGALDKCPQYPINSRLVCQQNICSYLP